jgi:TctA family transporter
MLRTIFVIGVFALLGLFVLKLAFNVLPLLLSMLLGLAFMALKIALVGAAVYFVIRVVSPDTARRLRSKWSGEPSM